MTSLSDVRKIKQINNSLNVFFTM